jgi:hypothetical protein
VRSFGSGNVGVVEVPVAAGIGFNSWRAAGSSVSARLFVSLNVGGAGLFELATGGCAIVADEVHPQLGAGTLYVTGAGDSYVTAP